MYNGLFTARLFRDRVRTIFLAAALLVLVAPLLAWTQPKTFAIVSDSHVGSPDSVYAAFIRIADERKFDFIIHAGDAIHNAGTPKQWKRFLEITGPGKILHLAPGNHDIHGKASLAIYLKFFPNLYYSFSEGDTLFVILNTELPGETGMITGEQLGWLKTELSKTFRYKFVVLHEPLFPLVTGHGLDRHKEERDRLHRLFVQKGVALVVSGHDHLYLRSEKQGITYLIVAAAGGNMGYFPKDADFFRYIVATRKNSGYGFVVRDLEGGTRDEFAIER